MEIDLRGSETGNRRATRDGGGSQREEGEQRAVLSLAAGVRASRVQVCVCVLLPQQRVTRVSLSHSQRTAEQGCEGQGGTSTRGGAQGQEQEEAAAGAAGSSLPFPLPPSLDRSNAACVCVRE